MRILQVSDQPSWRRFLVPALLALHVFLFTALGGTGLFRAEAETEGPLTHITTGTGQVALTFDVTWGTRELAQLVEQLQAQNVKATFFVGGTFLTLNPDLVKQLAAKGHEIATLGQRISDLSVLPEQEVASNLLATQSILSKTLGAPVRYFRPPHGPAVPSVLRGAKAADLITVMQSVGGDEHRGLSARELQKRVVKAADQGDIIRLTASDWSPETARALPGILQGLKAKGLQPVPLSELTGR